MGALGGPALAVTTGTVDGTPFAFYGSGPSVVAANVSDPANPVEVGALDTPGRVRGVFVTGGLAFVAGIVGGLRIVDVSDPSAPFEVGAMDTPDIAIGVFVSGELAFVADLRSGLRIVDVSDPTAPVEVGALDTPGNAHGVFVSGDLAFVAGIVDVSDPTAPVEVGALDTPGDARGIFVSGGLAFVADGGGGLLIIELGIAAAPVAGTITLQGQPDHSGTLITFEGPKSVSATTGPDGGFSVELTPGTYTMRAEHPYHLSVKANIEVGEGETVVLEAQLLCCDLDQDGDIDLEDLSLLGSNFNKRESPLR